jgi:hypothetical protein
MPFVKTRAPRGSKEKKLPKPPITVGMELVRVKDSIKFKVTKVDAAAKSAALHPVTKDEAEPVAAKFGVPVFWKVWREVGA